MQDWETTSLGSTNDSLVIDRREQFRTAPILDGIQLWLDAGRRLKVELLDHSETGIGVLLPGDVSFEFGPKVTVDYDGVRRTATVAYVTQVADGLRIGLQWAR